MTHTYQSGRPHARRRVALLVLCIAVPSAALAQNPASPPPAALKAPTIAASIASAADWATTYHALSNYRVHEVNPLLRPFERTPGKMISLGGAIDVAGISAWNMTMGRKHPKVAAAGLWGMAAFRTYLAIHNLRNTSKAERR